MLVACFGKMPRFFGWRFSSLSSFFGRFADGWPDELDESPRDESPGSDEDESCSRFVGRTGGERAFELLDGRCCCCWGSTGGPPTEMPPLVDDAPLMIELTLAVVVEMLGRVSRWEKEVTPSGEG